MSASLLDHPPRRSAPQPPAPPPPAVPPQAVPARPRRRRLWVFPVALVLSALIHAFFLLTLRFELVFEPPAGRAGSEAERPRPEGMRVYDIVAVDAPESVTIEDDENARPVPPRLVTPRLPQAGPLPTTTLPRETPEVTGARTTITERVAPRMVNPDLWATPPVELYVSQPADEVRTRVAGELKAWNDSVRAATGAAAKAVDWTIGDKEGGRWGVSPEGIHLGSITLPVLNQFVTPPGRRDEINALIRNWKEIQAQRSRAEVREELEERAKAIRERKEAERKDTTRVVRGGGG